MKCRNRAGANGAASDLMLGVSPEQGPVNHPVADVVNLTERRDMERTRRQTPLVSGIARTRRAMQWGPSEIDFEHPLMVQARAAINYAHHVWTLRPDDNALLRDAEKELSVATDRLDRYAAMKRHPAGPYREAPTPVGPDDVRPF